MIELTFHNKKHGTRTRGRIPNEGGLKPKQQARIHRDLCPRGCCANPIDIVRDLDGVERPLCLT